VVIPDSARWSKPSTGGTTEDEAHNFNRIVNSWYLNPAYEVFTSRRGHMARRGYMEEPQVSQEGQPLSKRGPPTCCGNRANPLIRRDQPIY
jgi:hypothetical protein